MLINKKSLYNRIMKDFLLIFFHFKKKKKKKKKLKKKKKKKKKLEKKKKKENLSMIFLLFLGPLKFEKKKKIFSIKILNDYSSVE